jgi:hypothetical protein
VFALVATANSGGYRFGISDQAFYEPAVLLQIDPALFPRDRPLLTAQTRLMAADKILGEVARRGHIGLPALFVGVYLLSLGLLAGGAIAVARALGFSSWATAAFLFALTLRHRIPKTGANSLEGYMHTRQLAFAVGVIALACLLRRRFGWMSVGLAAAIALHPTTGLWFGVLLLPALVVAEPAWRRPLLAGLFIAAVAAIWAITLGPLAARLQIMDAPWLAVLADKDYLFPTGWPIYAWLANLAYAPIVWLIYRQRAAAGAATRTEHAVLAGVLALVGIFVVSVPLTAWHIALAVQLQVTRVFWLLDFVATAYVAWWLTSSPWWSRAIGARRGRIVAVALLGALAVGRGYYILDEQGPRKHLIQVGFPKTPWIDALLWLRAQPKTWNVLADPGHAWKYGVSVRVAAEKDTLLESVKDSALAMYDRPIALRVADRDGALRNFDQLTTAQVRDLDARYGIDAVIVEHAHVFDLPVLYRNSEFVIYGLR